MIMIRLFFLVAKIRNYADIQKLFKILKVKKAEKHRKNKDWRVLRSNLQPSRVLLLSITNHNQLKLLNG
jgi:hypothetical protein